MKFKIKTPVEQSFQEADRTFDAAYLVELNPQFPPFKILRYDGIENSKEVEIELNFFLFKQRWIYVISDKKETAQEWSFADTGKKTPFFLKSWYHQYQMLNDGGRLLLCDTVVFKTPFFLLDYLLYPWLYMHFLYRRPVYKKRFSKK